MPKTAAELDVEELKLAWLQDLLGRVAGADAVVHNAEREMIEAMCPHDALLRAGLADPGGRPTALAEAATVRAWEELPKLPQDQRLQLVTPLAALAMADGRVDLRETSFVAVAGYALGLSMPVLRAHLAGTGVDIV